MKIPRIAKAFNHIDDDLITASESERKRKHTPWIKWGCVAACLAVLVIAVAVFVPPLFGGDTPAEKADGRYKGYTIQSGEAAIVWPWEYRTLYEKYTSLTLDGVVYRSHGRAVSNDLVGALIGTYSVIGYDLIADEEHSSKFEVYQLKYADKSQYVAVKMEDTCYVFKNETYNPPDTLGALFDTVNLPEAIPLNKFSEKGDGPDSKHFTLDNDDYLWEVLADCKNAAFVEDDKWTVGDREHLSFTVTSETLGVYRVALYVTADGYLWTNAFDWQYLFNIGEDAAEKIISYAKKNSTESVYEPYRNTIAGEITEITGEFILIDDSILCRNPSDGITYKIPLDDLRVSRYVKHGVVKVGDTVQIFYEGEMDGNIVQGVVSIDKAIITEEDFLIPE